MTAGDGVNTHTVQTTSNIEVVLAMAMSYLWDLWARCAMCFLVMPGQVGQEGTRKRSKTKTSLYKRHYQKTQVVDCA